MPTGFSLGSIYILHLMRRLLLLSDNIKNESNECQLVGKFRPRSQQAFHVLFHDNTFNILG